MAKLVSKKPVIEDPNRLTGPEKAAVILLALGEDHTALWERLDDEEVKEISQAMATLGNVTAEAVEALMLEFVSGLSGTGAVMGSFEQTQKLLSAFLPKDRVDGLMEEIRGPAGRTMWDKLGNVNEAVLANYLKNEYPQTVAVILSKVKSDHAARVLTALPEDFALECVQRMLRMEPVQREILDKIEATLRTEFMSNLARTSKRDSHEMMADIFNSFDRQTEARFIGALEERNRESAERIRALMFVFEDLLLLDINAVKEVLSKVDRKVLTVALKGTNDKMKEHMLQAMSQRGAEMLREDMDALGPIKIKEVEGAQQQIIAVVRQLESEGVISLNGTAGEQYVV